MSLDTDIEQRCRIIALTPGEKDKHILFANKVYALVLEYRGLVEANKHLKEISDKYQRLKHNPICKYRPAWTECYNFGDPFCGDHDGKKCEVCGEQADFTKDHDMGSKGPFTYCEKCWKKENQS